MGDLLEITFHPFSVITVFYSLGTQLTALKHGEMLPTRADNLTNHQSILLQRT